MDKLTNTLVYLAIIVTGIHAQAIDTSILKNGNTWLYSRTEENRSAGQLQDGFSGTMRFTIDSLVRVQDTVKFKVIRRDVGQYLIWVVGWDPAVDTTTATWFTFRNGGYSPSVPFFAVEQSFSDTGRMFVFRGDTVHRKSRNAGGCAGYNYINVEKLGRVTQSQTWGGCGNTSGQNSYQLHEFNGWAYTSDSISPVGIRSFVKHVGAGKAGVSLTKKYRVLLERNDRVYDLKGQKAAMPIKR